MSTATDQLTVDDYYRINCEGDGKELVDGVIVVNAPTPAHDLVRTRMIGALLGWVEGAEGHGMVLGAANVRLDEHNLFGPDAVWTSEEQCVEDLWEYPERVPEICVEVRSPGTWRLDVGKKKDAYERCGCPELWLVDHTEGRVLVYRRTRSESPTFDVELLSDDELASPQLLGFTLSLERLFRDL